MTIWTMNTMSTSNNPRRVYMSEVVRLLFNIEHRDLNPRDWYFDPIRQWHWIAYGSPTHVLLNLKGVKLKRPNYDLEIS